MNSIKKIFYLFIAVLAVLISGFTLTNSVSADNTATPAITFSGDNTTIYKNKNGVLLKSQILDLVKSDFTGSGITLDIKGDQYSGHGNEVGEYNISIVATSGQDSLKKNYKIKVVEGLFFDYAYGTKLFVGAGKHVTKDQMVKALKIMEVVPNIDMQFTASCDDYFDYSDTEGTFDCTYSYVATNGESGNGTLSITVTEESVYDIKVKEDVKLSAKIVNFFKEYKKYCIIGVAVLALVVIVYFGKNRRF